MGSENSLTTLGFCVLIKALVCNHVISTQILPEEHLKIMIADRPTEISSIVISHKHQIKIMISHYPLPKFINNLRKHPHPVTIKYAFAHLQQLQKSEN